MINTYVSKVLHDLKETSNIKLDAKLFANEQQLFDCIDKLKPFPQDIEHKYTSHLNYAFIKSGYSVIAFLISVLFLTLLSDLFFFNDSLIPFLSKISLIISCFIYLSFVFQKKFQSSFITSTTVMFIIGLLQLFISCIALDEPKNHYYSCGFFVIMMGSIILFRLCLKNIYFISLSVIIFQLLLEIFVFDNSTIAVNINRYILLSSIVIMVFGVLSSNLAVKSHRRDWLRSELLTIEKEKQTNLLKLMKQTALTDGLTKLFNRRFLDKKLDAYWHQHADQNLPLSVIMIDVDWFKKYNDNYGHQQGDKCLVNIAKILNNEVKKLNKKNQKTNELRTILARYGGEEFIIIMPNTFLATANTFANTLCSKVRAYRLVHEYSPLKHCSISLGVATVNRPSVSDKDISKAWLIKQADDALYHAKKQGKNQACDASQTNNISIESMQVL